MLAWSALTLLALIPLLAAEAGDRPLLRWLAKPVASAGFVGLGLSVASGPVGTAVGVALLLCMAGDLLLIPKGRAFFLAGLVAFLLGHVGYLVSFALQGLQLPATALAALGLAVIAAPVLRWLWPHVPGPMRAPVLAYVTVISAMVAASIGAYAAGASLLLPVGAVAFYLSDLFVARNRFVQPGPLNRLIGLPLYYGAQLLLASTAGP